MISWDFKIDNKLAATLTIYTDDTTINIPEPYVAKNTCKGSAKSEQNDCDKFNGIETIDWYKVKEFVEKNNIPLNDIESGVLESYITNGTLTEKQKRVLPHVLKRVQERGFKPSYPF